MSPKTETTGKNVDLTALEERTRKDQVHIPSDPVPEPAPEIDPDNIEQSLAVARVTLHGSIEMEAAVFWRILRIRIENNLTKTQTTNQ